MATGLIDVLPGIPGLADGWGETVLHCPCCHGYEVRDQTIGVFGITAMSYHHAMMFCQISDRVTFLQHSAPAPDEQQATMLESLGITFVDATVEAVDRTEAGTEVTLRPNDTSTADNVDTMHNTTKAATTTATGGAEADSAIAQMTFDALAVGHIPRERRDLRAARRQRGRPSGRYGLIPTRPNGATDMPASGATDVPGVWAVGNSADITAMVVASAAGVIVGAQVNAELIMSSVS